MVLLSDIKALHARIGAGPTKSAVVVGGTSGIGRGIAITLAKYNYNVTVVGRNTLAGESIVGEMKSINPNNQFKFLSLDASLMANCKEFSEKFKEQHQKLDCLVLTQGIASVNGFTPTSEGIDQKLALHYFSRIALIKSLLAPLKASESPRVLSVLSGGVHGVYSHFQDDFSLEKHFSIKNAADAAGFYNDCGLDSLSKEEPGVVFVHAAPGFVNTNWGSGFPSVLKWLTRAIQPLGRSIDDCGEFMSHPLLQSKDEIKAGFYVMGPDADPAKKTPKHEEARSVVWKSTLEILQKFGI
jgi:NAD(P)-dependent dehydrogenase (short-subunit alcohol dehydrogenase family)